MSVLTTTVKFGNFEFSDEYACNTSSFWQSIGKPTFEKVIAIRERELAIQERQLAIQERLLPKRTK